MDPKSTQPDSTAVRVALWRALHVRLDAAPHVLTDEIGLRMADPDPGWERRGDMDPEGTRGMRASIVARARFIEDLLVERMKEGVRQYVLLGAGLDSFVQRHGELANELKVFEVDQAGTQDWKRRRLEELGYGIPAWQTLVPVDFGQGLSWVERLKAEGFDPSRPSLVSSAGVSMYLTRESVATMLKDAAGLAPGSTFAMTFLLSLEFLDPKDRPLLEGVLKRAEASGTPFRCLFDPSDVLTLAREAGFKTCEHIATQDLDRRYFAGRSDQLHPATGESILVART